MEREHYLRTNTNEIDESALPRVQILIGADNNTLLVNGEKVHLTSGKKNNKKELLDSNVDTLFMLNYIQQNQGRWISSTELCDVLATRIKEAEPNKVSSRPKNLLRKYVVSRFTHARVPLLHRLKVDGLPIIANRQSLHGMELASMKFNITTQRVLIDLKEYPYPFNQPGASRT